MLTKGKVLSIDNNVAIVEVERKSACDGCHKNETGEGCSICSLTGGNRKFSAKALNKIGAKVGDTVEIASASSRVLFYSMLVFILPVIIGIAFYFIAEALFHTELYNYLALVLGFVLSLGFVWIYSKTVSDKRCDIEIVRVISRDCGEGV